MRAKNYDRNVFINCPFDDGFVDIFYAKVFCIYDCGFIARCSLEYEDATEPRIEKITRMISQCKYGVHDISYTDLSSEKLPRFNMPFELGLFIGAKKYGTKEQKEKLCLITDIEKYRFQKFLSDIAGQDIHAHGNNPEAAIALLSKWLRTNSKRKDIPGGHEINRRYISFKEYLPNIYDRVKINKDEIGFYDYCTFISEWLKLEDKKII